MRSVDLTVVAGRRPDLLSTTLEGFSSRVFARIGIRDVFVNIDPIFGGKEEYTECVNLLRFYFPDANIFEPEAPGFCAAVRRVWSATSADYIFHLEDDWLPLSNIGEEVFSKFDEPNVAQVSFHNADRKWNIQRKGPIHYMKIYRRIFGIKIPTLHCFPRFSTAPSILVGPFARRCAALMNEIYDPEKQFYSGLNIDLERFVRPYRNYIYSADGGYVIQDLGRSWSAKRGIVKCTFEGRSVWTKDAEMDWRRQ